MSTDLFEGLGREELMCELGCRMSRISKEATLDSWHYRVDDEMPAVCYRIAERGQADCFDTESISVLQARLLVAIAEELGHWVVPKKGSLDWEPYVPRAMKERASRTGHKADEPPAAD